MEVLQQLYQLCCSCPQGESDAERNMDGHTNELSPLAAAETIYLPRPTIAVGDAIEFYITLLPNAKECTMNLLNERFGVVAEMTIDLESPDATEVDQNRIKFRYGQDGVLSEPITAKCSLSYFVDERTLRAKLERYERYMPESVHLLDSNDVSVLSLPLPAATQIGRLSVVGAQQLQTLAYRTQLSAHNVNMSPDYDFVAKLPRTIRNGDVLKLNGTLHDSSTEFAIMLGTGIDTHANSADVPARFSIDVLNRTVHVHSIINGDQTEKVSVTKSSDFEIGGEWAFETQFKKDSIIILIGLTYTIEYKLKHALDTIETIHVTGNIERVETFSYTFGAN